MAAALDIELDPRLLGNDAQHFKATVVPALVLYRHLQAELSLGEAAAELIDKSHVEVLDWLTALGVPTLVPLRSMTRNSGPRRSGRRDDLAALAAREVYHRGRSPGWQNRFKTDHNLEEQ